MSHDGSQVVLALDLGGTEVKAGVVDVHGAVLATERIPSGESAGMAEWRNAGLRALRALPSTAAAAMALGLAVPGAVDSEHGTLLDLVDRLPGAAGLSLPEAFADVGVPVHAENDAVAALMAEQRWGRARGFTDVVMLTLGTGLGSAVIVDGKRVGRSPLFGNQLGHVSLDLAGPRCVCGNTGCAELWTSGPGLLRLARSHGLHEVQTARQVFDAARRGSREALLAVEELGAALAAVVVTAVHAYQPQLVVLGGGLMGAADIVLPPLRAAVSERAWTVPRGRVRVEASALGRDLGVLGAAAVALQGASVDDVAQPVLASPMERTS